jgi:quinolinate synthase
VKIVGSLSEKEIIFVPDKNLGHYVSRFFPEKTFILFNGFCPTHNKFSPSDIDKVRAALPNAPILVHPECVAGVIDKADFTGSTAQIIDRAVSLPDKEIVIGTESGVIHRLQKLCPEKTFYSLSSALTCPNMKKTTLTSLYDSLDKMQHKIELDARVMEKAYASVNRMFTVR